MALLRSHRPAGVQLEPGSLSDSFLEGLITGRLCLQRKRFPTLLWSKGDAVVDRRTHELFHRAGLGPVASFPLEFDSWQQ